ncbi:MAG TPA: phosphatase PAP2 family protein [Solirubrobacterales bacterium]|nr:phosphatase PAP2 family protein [Solirubrobacterales bacterium]
MPRNVKAPLFAAFLCAAAIVPLAVTVYWFDPAETLDRHLLFDLRREVGLGHTFGAAFVNLGDLAALLVLLATVCAIGLRFGRRREVLAAVVVVAGANVTTQALKSVLEHVRSKAFEHGYELPWPNSFPSGHTTAAASIAVALLLVVPAAHRLLAAAIGAALTGAVGLSVVILGWHYPSDVLGALLVVAAWGLCAVAYLRQRQARDTAVRTRRPERRGPLAVSTD